MPSAGLMILGFVLLFVASTPLYAVILDRIAAIVNDDVITQSEVYATGELNLQLAGLPDRGNVLDHRIDHHLILQQLTKQPPVQIDEEDIQTEVNAFIENHGGKESASQFLSSIGLTDADLETEIREEITIRQFVTFRFRPFVNVSLDQAEQYYNDVHVPRLKAKGLPVHSLTDSFDDIQNELIQSQVQERLKNWLGDLRKSANITIKE